MTDKFPNDLFNNEVNLLTQEEKSRAVLNQQIETTTQYEWLLSQHLSALKNPDNSAQMLTQMLETLSAIKEIIQSTHLRDEDSQALKDIVDFYVDDPCYTDFNVADSVRILMEETIDKGSPWLLASLKRFGEVAVAADLMRKDAGIFVRLESDMRPLDGSTQRPEI